MKLLYSGKTKDVYQTDDNLIVLKFKDDVTGVDGKFDPGANQVGLSIQGMGHQNVLLTSYFFELLKDKGIPSHYVSSDKEANSLTVKPAKVYGKGIEVISRYRAVGSFYRRYGDYIEQGAALDNYVEVTLKDDLREDPLVTREGLIALNIMTSQQYDKLIALNLEVVQIIQAELAKQGIELYDIKLEFGYEEDPDEMILIDEVSGGNMRVYKEGVYIQPMDLAQYFDVE